MRILAASVLTILFQGPLGAQVHVLEQSVRKQSRIVTVDSRRVELEQESFQAIVAVPSTLKTSQIDVVILYEPVSKLFWSHYVIGEAGQTGEIERFLANTVFYVLESKIVCFMFQSKSLWVAESAAHYASLEDGRAKVLGAIDSRPEELLTSRSRVFRKVDLGKTLPFTFYELSGNSNPTIEPTVRAVSRINGHWQLVLDGPNGDSATVTLSNNYDVLRAAVSPAK